MPPTIVQQPTTTTAPQSQTVTVSTPVVQTVATETPKPTEVNTQDLIKRASAIQTPVTPTSEAPRVNLGLEDVKDPVARQILEKKLAEANSAISKTFGEIGAEKSKYLQEMERLKQTASQPWSPQRLQEELRKQDFVTAAQQLQAQVAPQGYPGSQDDWSALNPGEKSQIQNMLANQNTMAQQMNQMLISQVDTTLRNKYPDYDSTAVDRFVRDAQEGRVTPDQVREMVHKALNAEKWAERSYQFALQDKTVTIQDKLNGLSPNGLNVTPTTTNVVDKQPSERSAQAFSAHAHKVLDMIRSLPKR